MRDVTDQGPVPLVVSFYIAKQMVHKLKVIAVGVQAISVDILFLHDLLF